MVLSAADIRRRLTINPQHKKTFVFDLDGTIVYDGKPVDNNFSKLLFEVKQRGHEIVFATGRSFRDFVPVVPDWAIGEPSVVFGGGLVIADDKVKYQRFINHSHVAEIARFLEDNQVYYLIDGKTNFYHPAREHRLYQEIFKLTGQVKAQSLNHVYSDGAYKILVLDDNWLGYFKAFIEDKELAIKYHFYDKCFDLVPANVNKYNGLKILDLPNPHDVFVFGNDHNDLELMQNLPNSIMFGRHRELVKHAKIMIDYDNDLFSNFKAVMHTILGSN